MEKERRTKALLLSTLVVVVATLSIAFAAMSRTLSINGIGKMDTATWSVYFDNLSDANIVRGAEEVGKPKISDDKGIVQDINVKLSNPKDEISYTVDIVNDGTIDAEITMIKDIELTEVQKKVFEFRVTYTDTGDVLKDGDLLPAGDTKNITITIRFKDDITEADLPTEQQIINLSYQITYTQYDGSEIVIEPDGGDITTGKAVLAPVANPNNLIEDGELVDITESFFNCTTIIRDQVESLNFVNNTNVPTEAQSTVWDASETKDNSIIGWYQDTDLNDLYEVYIGSNVNIYAPRDSSALFAAFLNLNEINFNNFNTSDITNMYGMFFGCISLPELELNLFDTSKATDMSYMFYHCNSLTSLDLSSFDTSNVTDMSDMFSNCSALTSLDLSSFDTSNVTNMSWLFYYCEFESLNLSSFDTVNVINMAGLFSFSLSNFYLDLSNFYTPNLENIDALFEDGTLSSVTIDLRNADFSKVTINSAIYHHANITDVTIIVSESQKDLATSIFAHDEVTIKTPSEL